MLRKTVGDERAKGVWRPFKDASCFGKIRWWCGEGSCAAWKPKHSACAPPF